MWSVNVSTPINTFDLTLWKIILIYDLCVFVILAIRKPAVLNQINAELSNQFTSHCENVNRLLSKIVKLHLLNLNAFCLI